jgi:proteic killer suppression protein
MSLSPKDTSLRGGKAVLRETYDAQDNRFVIRSFADPDTEVLFVVGAHRRFSNFADVALRKLDYLKRARTLRDLRTPPGNRLEALYGNRKGQHSIRINDQYRICFRWQENGVHDVEIVDYH